MICHFVFARWPLKEKGVVVGTTFDSKKGGSSLWLRFTPETVALVLAISTGHVVLLCSTISI